MPTINSTHSSVHPQCGYHGQYLRIDLSTGSSELRAIPHDMLRRYLGGTGLGVWLLLHEQLDAVSPLSVDAGIAFVFSPLVGSPLTTSAKFAVVGKSPLTGRYNDSLASSGFAIAGKQTGADAILIVGRANRPTVVVVDNGSVSLLDATELWGQDVSVTQAKLQEQLPSDYRFAVIGPAGEREVRFATISHDGRHAGRGGMGAVLGHKRVKAIAVRGKRRCQWADPTRLAQYSRDLSQRSFGPATAKYRELGTASNLLVFNRLQTLPTRNFQESQFADVGDISAETLRQTRSRTQASCVACTIGCEHLYGLRDESTSVRVEYESLFALGSLCGISDAESVLRAVRLCDEVGIDTISAGGTIAFAMECVQHGWLSEPWLRFGDSQALLRAIAFIAERREVGDRLAMGSRHLATSLGPDALAIAPQVKGLELPGFEPRAMQTLALAFAVGTRGADHNRSGAYDADFSERVDRRRADDRSVDAAIQSEDQAVLMDSAILCKFLRRTFDDFFVDLATMLTMTTGWDITGEELQQTAQRIITARKWFNIRAGWIPDEDTLPARFLETTPANDAAAILPRERLEQLIRQYNHKRGWSPEGWIDHATLGNRDIPHVTPIRHA